MEQKETSWRFGTIRTIFSGFYSIYSFFRRPNTSADYSKTFLSSSRGFTLVEIITALGVLAILATVVLAAVNPLEQFRKAQDTKRKSDLAQIQRALEAYYQDFDKYPAHTPGEYTINTAQNGDSDTAVDWGDVWAPYLDILPKDPNSSKYYIYIADDLNGYQSYRIYTSLDRGIKDPDACQETTGCPNAPANCGIDSDSYCNFGLSSPNVSP